MKKHVTILLVEDDPGHALLLEKNLRRSKITNKIIILNDGRKALDFLFSEGEYKGTERPSPLLLLLDLNLPGTDGYKILKRIKDDESTKQIPVVILTTTDDDHEVLKCYELGCNIYITKPVNYEKFTEAVRKIGLFFSIIKIPDGE